jgi:hypothetical protein
MHPLAFVRSSRILRLGALLAMLGVLVVLVGRPAVQAERPEGWRVGDPMTTLLPIASPDAARVSARVATLAASIGLDGSPAPGARQSDLFLGHDFDEVVFTTADGTHTADVMIDPATGVPFMIARFDRPPGFDVPSLTASTAVPRARELAATLGLSVPAGTPRVQFNDALGSWEVAWDRYVDRVIAPGFETTIGVYPGGQFGGLSAPPLTTAPRPTRLIAPSRATSIALQWAIDNGMFKRSRFRMQPPTLEWRQPNNYWDPTKPDAPSPVLRLSYHVVLSYDIGDPHPQLVHLVIDAGDGTIIAGAVSS